MKSLLEEKCGLLQSLVKSIMAGKIEPDQLQSTQVTTNPNSSFGTKFTKPNLLILFVVGGISLEEAALVQNMKDCDIELIVGGTHLLDGPMYALSAYSGL